MNPLVKSGCPSSSWVRPRARRASLRRWPNVALAAGASAASGRLDAARRLPEAVAALRL